MQIRWVVESANARIKSWKYFKYVLPNSQIPSIADYLKIVCAISNKYFQPLSTCGDDDFHIASKMRESFSHTNTLKKCIEDNNLEKKSSLWKSVDHATLDDFPKLNEEKLRSLTFGVYQLKLSPSYIHEHLEGNCDIQIHNEESNLIRVKIQSRHVSSRRYLLWLKFSSTDIDAWYCKCRAGERVVGMCSHIAAVVWYLSYSRHEQNQKYGIQNWGEYLTDASKVPETIDDTDSDTDVSVIEE